MRRLRILISIAAVLALTGCGVPGSRPDYRTETGQRDAVAALVSATGGSTFDLIDFFSDHVTAVGPTHAGATTFDDWYYRGGRAMSVAPEPDQPAADELFDVSKLDLSKLEQAMRKTLQLTGMTANKDSHIVVQRVSAEGVPITPPTIEVLLDDGYHQAYVIYDFDLHVMQKTGNFFPGR